MIDVLLWCVRACVC